jgi:hypothetical protein
MGLRAYLDACGTPNALPEIAGRYAGRSLVICGDGHNIWEDLDRFGAAARVGRGQVAKPGWDFMSVNKIGETFPGNIEHWYSNEPRVLVRIMPGRRDQYTREFPTVWQAHSISELPPTNGIHVHVWPLGGHGTSSLGATLVGIGLGYDRIALCGIPLDDGPHNGEPPWRTTSFRSSEAAGGQRKDENPHWMKGRDLAFDGKVRSMSGRTRIWLGDAAEWA